MSATILPFRRPARRPAPPATLAAPAFAAGILAFSLYSAFALVMAQAAVSSLDAWRR